MVIFLVDRTQTWRANLNDCGSRVDFGAKRKVAVVSVNLKSNNLDIGAGQFWRPR